MGEFINYPISLWTEKTADKEVDDDDDDEDDAKDGEDGDEPKIEEVEEEEEANKKEKKKKKVKEVTHEWDLMNKQKPIWTRKPEEVTKEGTAPSTRLSPTTGRSTSPSST